MNKLRCLSLFVCLLCPVLLQGQSPLYYQPHFPPEEFKARWEKIFGKIGDKSVALVAGAPSVGGFLFPRQFNEFYYLCGVETPGSYMLLDGRSHRVGDDAGVGTRIGGRDFDRRRRDLGVLRNR